jgi:eukaryotic-like serine/threonine-protein kinase
MASDPIDRPSDSALGTGGRTMPLPPDEVPQVASLALIAAGRAPVPPLAASTRSSLSNTTAAAAMRDEEVERTRLFIRMGWLLSVAVMATVPFVAAPLAMSATLVAGLVIGMIVSFVLHQRFADPQRYTEGALLALAVICCVNGNLGVMYYGAFTAAPLMIVVGIHFVARTEAERVARWILVCALVLYTATATLIITGLIDDPGVFATNRTIDRGSFVVGTVFVLGTFVLAYETARMFRQVSLAAIEDLNRATRLASEREAVMDELRADLERALRIGGPGRYTDQVVGSFRLGIVLGRGAIGEVYDATHVDSGEPAAVKLLRRELLADATQVARFLREARASAAIDSPHVARVLAASHPNDALPYLAAERLLGHTLADLLRREPHLASDAIVELCRHVGAGLDAAAAASIVHRDLKPQNVMRHADTWKILDFGVATFAEDSGVLTRGEAVGTPHYMAPEQAQGKPVDSAADRYALGAIIYRCLTGRHPFLAADTTALLYSVVHRTPPRPGSLAELPADIDRWCAIALAKSPSDRFASGAAMTTALTAALAGELPTPLRSRADALIRKHPWGPA